MSKAFTKQDDADAPLLAPSLPPLPDGVPNYVTPRGLEQLKSALDGVRHELESCRTLGLERARSALLAERARQLETRLAQARLVEPVPVETNQVHFGARVRLRHSNGRETQIQIVGVDEADPSRGLVAFTAPLARALIGAAPGDEVSFKTPRGEEQLELLGVAYGDELGRAEPTSTESKDSRT